MTTWYEHGDFKDLDSDGEMNDTYWQVIRRVRDIVNKQIENTRKTSQLGSALEVKINLYAHDDLPTPKEHHGNSLLKKLRMLKDDLRFVLITTDAAAHPYDEAPEDAVNVWEDMVGLKIKISVITDAKCDRCWQRRADVGSHAEHPTICNRCIENVDGQGEVRHYA